MASEVKTEPESSSAEDMPHEGDKSHADSQAHSSPDGKQCQCCASAGDMTATLKDIRKFMRSAMKSLDLPVPEDNDPKIEISLLKPLDSMYKEEVVLNFWRQLLPLGPRLGVLRDQVLLVFTREVERYPDISPIILLRDGNSKVKPLFWGQSGNLHVVDGRKPFDLIRGKWPESLGQPERNQDGNFIVLFSWDFSSTETVCPLRMEQCSYDKDGYPINKPIEFLSPAPPRKRQVNITGTQRYEFIVSRNTPWDLQQFAVVWYMPAPTTCLPFRLLAFILSQLEIRNPAVWIMESPATSFVRRYTGPWPSRKWGLHDWCSSTPRERSTSLMQYHIRFFSSKMDRGALPNLGSPEGIGYDRGKGSIRSLGSDFVVPIIEGRVSVALNTSTCLELPTFVLVILIDFEGLFWIGAQERDEWSAVNILPCLEFTGIAAFQYTVCRISTLWSAEWNEFLDSIDKALTSELRDLLNPLKRTSMMFDNNSFTRSELYFATLQLLRISSEWIRGSMEDLESLAQGTEIYLFEIQAYLRPERDDHDPTTANVARVLRQNWKNVLAHQKRLGKPLLDRIEKKTEEVKSLRDGLFNATAVREASRSSTLNHYILVFTVMTIVYLPLSFTAGLFALNLFQLDHPRQKTAFITTIVLVAMSTYFVSGFLIWFVRTEERRHMFMHLWNRRADGASNIEGGPKDESFPFHTILQKIFASKRQKTSSEKANNPSNSILQSSNV